LDYEAMPVRTNAPDPRIHVCLYFLHPSGHSVSPLDVHLMKQIGQRINLIPVVAKADSLSPAHLSKFKQIVRPSFSAIVD
jgi:cell division control protein 12